MMMYWTGEVLMTGNHRENRIHTGFWVSRGRVMGMTIRGRVWEEIPKRFG